MTTLNTQQVNEQGLYQPAHQPLIGKDNLSQKFEFDSPNTLAKQSQFQQAGGQQQWAGQQGLGQGLQSGSFQAPPLPQSRARQPRRQINLRTRDWNNQPWSHQGQGQWGGDSYRPPASLLGGGLQQGSSSLPPLHPAGLPTSNYQPSSTIPMQHNYHLPHSQLATSSVPAQQQDIPSARLNKNYLPGETLGNNSLNANNFGNNTNNFGTSNIGNNQFGGLNSGLNNNIANNNLNNTNNFGNSNIGNNQFGGIPNAPAWTGFRRGYQRNQGQRRQLRPLRTRNWGSRTENGWSGFSSNNAVQEGFLQNRMRFAPDAPRMAPAFGRQRQWQRGPYRMRPLRTRHWGLRTENGWAHFNSGIYANEHSLPFNNRNRNLNWADESTNSGLNNGYNNGLNNGLNNNYTNTPYMPQQNQGVAPVAALAPLTNRNQGKRASRRQARKQAKQAAIAQQLNTHINPPVGDPAVNHYRRGAPAAVPITGAAPGGFASSSGGKLSSRRRGRRNNLGRRRGRNAQNALPVPATQPPFVAPVAAAPLAAAPMGSYPSATYRTVYNNANTPAANFVNQPSTAFRPVATQQQGLYNNAPTSNAGNFSRAGLYTSSELQQRPLSNTMGNSSGIHSNLPLYSAHEPVAAQILEKRAQAPIAAPPARGNATF